MFCALKEHGEGQSWVFFLHSRFSSHAGKLERVRVASLARNLRASSIFLLVSPGLTLHLPSWTAATPERILNVS